MNIMKLSALKSNFILLLVAIIWGTGFVAQRMGMEHIGPFTFNGIRFLLGCIPLIPFVFLSKDKLSFERRISLIKSGIISGVFLFFGISFQQVGLVYTTAGKAGFITGLYVVIVPILGLLINQTKTSPASWIGAVMASVGIYFLSIKKGIDINPGDILTFFSAICFAIHLIVISRFTNQFDTTKLSFVQFFFCGVISLITAAIFENLIVENILNSSLPLIYGGIISVGIAYTLQIYGQKETPATNAAIILSLESVFAVLSGWLILNEILSGRAILGCTLMLSGIIISQLFSYKPTLKT